MVSKDTYIAVLAGMGGFSDGFALLLGGSALLSLSHYFRLTAGAEGLIISASFLGSIIGAVAFGRLADLLGRRVIFLNVLLFFLLGSMISALAPSILVLIAGRLMVGMGIGGDIPSGLALVAELSDSRKRGGLLAIQSILWGLGGASAALVALPLLSLGNIAWRPLFGLGAIPPLVTLVLRREISESWVWKVKRSEVEVRIRNRGRYVLMLAFTSASLFAWTFILAIFANYTPSIMVSTMGLSKAYALLIGGAQWLGFVAGGLMVLRYCDRIGRRILLIPATVGEAALLYASIFLLRNPLWISLTLVVLWILGGVGYVVNSVYSAELFPTLLRGTSSGVAFSMGRLGGYVSTLILPMLLLSIRLAGVFALLAVLMTPLALTCPLIAPRSEGKGIDELEREYY